MNPLLASEREEELSVPSLFILFLLEALPCKEHASRRGLFQLPFAEQRSTEQESPGDSSLLAR